jgi:gamma-glutamyltranspeptidase / glutathione hydrolase
VKYRFLLTQGHSPQQEITMIRAIVAFVGATVLFHVLALAQESSHGIPLPTTGRSVIATRYGIVAASQPLAATAGIQILERGGNAVDAAIATNSVIGLMEPTSNGIGGDLFAIVYEAKTGKVYGLNSSGWAPGKLTPEFLAAKGVKEMPQRGIDSATVPGAVAGWQALHDRFGTLPLSTLLKPAIYYAENGVAINEVTAGLWSRSVAFLASHPNSGATYLIDGRAPKPGEVFRNADLAKSLRRIADRGRDGYYKGTTAQAIVDISKEMDGTMTFEDLADFQPEWVEPISTTYRGWKVYEIPPNSQGIAALTMLNLMEQFPLAEYGFQSARSLHVMIEAKKLAYADMLRYVGDPRFSKIPVAQMLDKQLAVERAKLITDQAQCSVQPSVLAGVTDAKGKDTIYMTVMDKQGNIVSLIQSNYAGFGSGVVPKGMGFMLQNRGALFTLDKGQPNTLAGRKRPLHTIIPAFMEKGNIKIGFGIMGGWNQAQAHAQFVSDIVDYGLTIQQALEAGRFTKSTFDGCDVQVEERVPDSVRNQLAEMGHKVQAVPIRTPVFGYGQAVMSNGAGVHFGASDPRHDGEAIPEPGPIFDNDGTGPTHK